MKISKVQERIQLWALMYNHKGPFYALARSISGQRWSDILCCLWGIKDTLWVKGSQLLRRLQTGRSLVWNLNTNSDSKTKFLPVPLAWERLARIVRVNRAGGQSQGEVDKPQWFPCSRDPRDSIDAEGPILVKVQKGREGIRLLNWEGNSGGLRFSESTYWVKGSVRKTLSSSDLCSTASSWWR